MGSTEVASSASSAEERISLHWLRWQRECVCATQMRTTTLGGVTIDTDLYYVMRSFSQVSPIESAALRSISHTDIPTHTYSLMRRSTPGAPLLLLVLLLSISTTTMAFAFRRLSTTHTPRARTARVSGGRRGMTAVSQKVSNPAACRGLFLFHAASQPALTNYPLTTRTAAAAAAAPRPSTATTHLFMSSSSNNDEEDRSAAARRGRSNR